MADRPRDRSICLNETDFSETSQVLHMFTRTGGIVHMLAKGSRRTKSSTGGRIDLLSDGEVVYIPSRNDKLATLTEFTERSNHSGLRKDYHCLTAALFMIESTTMVLGEGDVNTAVFDLLAAALDRLDKPQAPVKSVLAYFLWRLLTNIGLLGELGCCVNCGLPAQQRSNGAHSSALEVYFTSAEGGMLCKNCHSAWSDKLRLGAQVFTGIDVLLNMKRRQGLALDEKQAQSLFELFCYHLCWQMGKTPKSLRFLSGQASLRSRGD